MNRCGPTWYSGAEALPAGTLAHYSNAQALKKVVRAGVLLPHKTRAIERHALIWASTNPVWEPGALRLFSPVAGVHAVNFEMQASLRGGPARLLLAQEACPLDIRGILHTLGPEACAHITPAQRRTILATVQGVWWGSTAPIGEEWWIRVELWRGHRWVFPPSSWLDEGGEAA